MQGAVRRLADDLYSGEAGIAGDRLLDIPSGLFLMGKFTVNWPFSIAMLNYQRVDYLDVMCGIAWMCPWMFRH